MGYPMNERELIKGVIGCDSEAQAEFFNLFRTRIYRSCVYLLGFQDGEAEDIVQETFLIALKRLPEFDFRHKLITWLTQIAMNLCYERIRARKRLILMLEKDIEAVANMKLYDPAAQLEAESKAEILGILRKLRAKLGRICKKLLELRDQQGMSYVEISRILRLPIGTVMSRLHRCRALLKERALAEFGGAR